MDLPKGRPSKKIPAPFKRPVISLSGVGDKLEKDWQWVSPTHLVEGDILAGHGLVCSYDDELDSVLHRIYVVLQVGFPESRIIRLPEDELVFAFTAKD